METTPSYERSAERFEVALEDVVKRYAVDTFALSAVERMTHYRGRGTAILSVPHRVAQAIEANCAYFRGHRSRRLDDVGYRQIANVFAAHPDRGLSRMLPESLDVFMLYMFRQQMEIQRAFAQQDLARCQRLFMRGAPIPRLHEQFARKVGVSIPDWFKAGFCMYARASQGRNHSFLLEPPYVRGISVESHVIERYLKWAVSSPGQIGERYRRLRSEVSAKDHALIRTVFFSRPIIAYDERRHAAPFPHLILHHAANELYEILKGLDGFDQEFGNAVENYVGFLLSQIPGARIIGGRELRLHTDSHCDFLVELSSEILLVEAKATSFTRNFLTERTIRSDGSTRAISHGVDQLYASGQDLLNQKFAPLGILAKGRPIHMVIATFGHVALANSPWYLETFILDSCPTDPRLVAESAPSAPAVLSLPSLELLVAALCAGDSCAALMKEKAELGFVRVGDWDTFLENRARDGARCLPMSAAAQRDFQEFCDLLGTELQPCVGADS